MGYQVAERLRAALGREVVLTACTANGESEDYLRAYRAGFDAHLTKPVDPEELVVWLNAQGSLGAPETSGRHNGDEGRPASPQGKSVASPRGEP
jgi:CheY-like chemotaxis protein